MSPVTWHCYNEERRVHPGGHVTGWRLCDELACSSFNCSNCNKTTVLTTPTAAHRTDWRTHSVNIALKYADPVVCFHSTPSPTGRRTTPHTVTVVWSTAIHGQRLGAVRPAAVTVVRNGNGDRIRYYVCHRRTRVKHDYVLGVVIKPSRISSTYFMVVITTMTNITH